MVKLKAVMLSMLTFAFVLALAPVAMAQDNAQVRVIHASPDAPAVDVYVDGNAVLTNVPFFTVSDYLDVPAGEHRFQVTPTGESVDSAVIDTTATLEAGTAYTVAATGEVANISPTIIVDDLSAPAAGQAKVRVYHFSPDAPAVDVKLADGTTLLSGLAFPDASDYLEVDAGTYDLSVTPAGDDTVVIDLAGTSLQAGNIYDVFATNVVASITPEVNVTTPAAAPAPAATAAPAPAGDAPATLPTTADGDSMPLALLAIGAALLVGMGALLLRRRATR